LEFKKEENKMRLKAGSGRVIVNPINEEELSKSGIIIAPGSKEIREGIVIAVDPAYNINIGDKVMYHKMAFVELMLDEKKYHVLNVAEILAILSIK
jgi:co-chaperonin GroES (HSP10)